MASLFESSKRREEMPSRRLGAMGLVERRRRWEGRESVFPSGLARSEFEGRRWVCISVFMGRGASS